MEFQLIVIQHNERLISFKEQFAAKHRKGNKLPVFNHPSTHLVQEE